MTTRTATMAIDVVRSLEPDARVSADEWPSAEPDSDDASDEG
jgi:hypothetical protein